ncbi:nitrate reductase molybdenum cofactor assembly chaperone [Pseudemcibacter aquimaris]|uniref:nitrate reductase molybdenum cofactor assembly chaperone n=1 Tax=Pseudemcibacter aquimaris TaxID=2857064 RepID=UPI002010F5B2|nr:nitrate reductase molybdenum cofactor assembly chaperone [Pseudemcibacter aquimaris]MCC3861866.1 nitrate reductase molybdenum cofactor assembly chaperone [Pseudemcibacter aquimaris]WDU58619.1 nitrate reductase molybdenum cofactor assembly chaperone [Pseudemcibacter aquimaris]
MRTFKIIGLLLSYPKQELIDHLDEVEDVLKAEEFLPKRTMKKVLNFISYMKQTDLYELQEEYVDLFDRGRAHCLHMFEHIHGESRDRGQAMVNLIESYADRGFYMQEGELPDYLPLFLEYLSTCPADEAVDLVGDPINVIATIGIRLKKRDSLYYILFEALEALAKVKPDDAIIAEAKAEEIREQTLDELDEEWQEAEAFDNSKDCGTCDMTSYHANNTHLNQPLGGAN